MTRLVSGGKSLLLALTAAIAPVLLLVHPASAAEPPAVAAPETSPGMSGMPPDEPWEFKFGMYGWMSSVDATVGAGGTTANVHASFSDIFQKLGWAVMMDGEVRYERAILLLDTFGLQVADGATSGERTRTFERNILGPVQVTAGPVDASVRSTIWMLDTKLGWRALHVPLSKLWGPAEPDDRRIFDADVFAGFRYWNVDTKISTRLDPARVTVRGVSVSLPGGRLPPVDLGGGITLGRKVLTGGRQTATETIDWADPLLGLRLRTGVTESVSLVFLGDVGGFGGIGSTSKFSWQAMLGANWAMSEHWSLLVAYRALGITRSNALEDMTMYGPQIGIGVRF